MEPLALQCADGRFDWDTGVRVNDFDVLRAARCQASVAGPPEAFSPTVFTTFKAIARGATQRLVTDDGIRGALLAYVRAARRGETAIEPWIRDFLDACDQAELLETVHRAATWIHRTRAALGDEGLARCAPGRALRWDHPDRGLRLQGSVDLVDDRRRPIIVVPSVDDHRWDQIAYVAMLYTLRVRSAPDTVIVIDHATGIVTERRVDELTARATEAATRALRAVIARPAGPAGLYRTPSWFTCRACAWHDGCAARGDDQDRVPIVRGGIRLG